jgi:N-sulfoglucosamine sulfohydrolase
MNILTVICHDLGQRLGCYGVPNIRSHDIDRFAEGAVRFENAFCTAPQCSPARAALWTGRYPHANGVVGLAHSEFGNDLHPGERHLAQILGDTGYQTILFGTQHVSPTPKRCGFKEVHGRGSCVKIAKEFADHLPGIDRDRPFHIQIGFGEPHRPYGHDGTESQDPSTVDVPGHLPDIPEVREDLADMEASIASVDIAFGMILEALDRAGLADDTLVMFVADHGIPHVRSKMTLYDPGLEIALVMRIPGVEGGRAPSEMISNVDVMPTILELLGMDVPQSIQGRSFLPLLQGTGYEPRDAVFGEKTYHAFYDPMRAIRTERWKLIANFEAAPAQETPIDYANNARSYVETLKAAPPPFRFHPALELYDLQSDPHEANSLAEDPAHEAVRIDLARRLRDWMVETNDPLLDGPIAQATYTKRMAAFKEM